MTKDEHKKPKQPTHHPAKKVFDVTRPGKAPASPTSRPVIASKKPPVSDDQFVPSAPPLRPSDPSAKHDLMNPKNKKELKPLDTTPPAEAATGASKPEPDTPGFTGAPALPGADKATVKVPEQPGTVPAVALENTPAPSIPTEPAGVPPVPETSTVAADVSKAADNPQDSQPPTAVTSPTDTGATPPGQSVHTEEETPAHLALEQTVDASDMPIWEHPDTSQQVEGTTPVSTGVPANTDEKKSIEDLLAETGAPVLEPEQSPSLIISHHNAHSGRWWKVLLAILLLLIVAAVALNILLDAEILTGVDLPHTELL